MIWRILEEGAYHKKHGRLVLNNIMTTYEQYVK